MKKILLALIFISLPLFVCLPVGKVLAEQIDINSANLSQLDGIVHIGPKTAQKIIDDRPYSSVQDLSRVKGIGNGKYLQDIINQGWACVNCSIVIPSLTGNPATNTESPQNTLDSPLQGNDNKVAPVTVTAPTPTPAIAYPGGVFINEILPNPKGPDGTDEWIELYNSNNFDVDLSGWQLQDTVGTITNYTIPPNTNIVAGGFLVFKRPETNIMLNNDQDGLNLLTPDKKIVDAMDFTSAPLGQSYNKINSGWKWSATLTPGAANIITAIAKIAAKSLPKTNNSVNNNVVKAGLADLSQNTNINQTENNTTNPWFLFFSVLATTIILAAIVLLIKLKLKKNVRT